MATRTPSPPVAQARGRVAALSRSRAADDPEFVEAKRSLKMANLEEYVSEVVSTFPELTPEQRDKIAVILRRGVSK